MLDGDRVLPNGNAPTAWVGPGVDEEYIAAHRPQGKKSDGADDGSEKDSYMSFVSTDFSIHMLGVARATDASSPNPLVLVASFDYVPSVWAVRVPGHALTHASPSVERVTGTWLIRLLLDCFSSSRR